MKIVHYCDYVMPEVGYQEFLLPLAQSEIGNSKVYIITSDRYKNVNNYLNTWGKLLGKRIQNKSISKVKNLIIIRKKPLIEFFNRIFTINVLFTLRKLKPDLLFVHSSTCPMIFLFAIFKNALGVKIMYADNHMITQHHKSGYIRRLYYFLLKVLTKNLLLNKVERFFGVGENCCQYLNMYQSIPKSKINLLPLGIKLNNDTKKIDDSIVNKLKHFKQHNYEIICQPGKITSDKGHLLTAQALKNISCKHKFVFLCLGDGNPNIKKSMYDVLGKENIFVTGFVPASLMRNYLQFVDLVIFGNGSSLSCFDAAYCNKKILMCDLDINIEREKQGICKLFATNSYIDLSLKIEYYFLTWKNENTNLKKFIASNYSYENQGQILNQYLQVDLNKYDS